MAVEEDRENARALPAEIRGQVERMAGPVEDVQLGWSTSIHQRLIHPQALTPVDHLVLVPSSEECGREVAPDMVQRADRGEPRLRDVRAEEIRHGLWRALGPGVVACEVHRGVEGGDRRDR